MKKLFISLILIIGLGVFSQTSAYTRILASGKLLSSAKVTINGMRSSSRWYVDALPKDNIPNLIAYWTFDGQYLDWSTGVVTDIVGGNNGTLSRMSTSTSPVAGIAGQALNFNGVNNYIDVGTSATLEPTAALTVSVWVYRTGNTSGNAGIFSSRKDASNQGGYVLISGVAVVNDVRFYIWSGAWNFVELNAVLPARTWSHIVGTWDGTTMKIYLNGVQQTLTAAVASISYSPSPTQNHFIGRYQGGGNEKDWPGYIDEVRIYNRALSNAEIYELYRKTNRHY